MPKIVCRRSMPLALACALALPMPTPAEPIDDTTRTVELPAGELMTALKKLAEQSGIEFVYSPEQLKGVHTGGAHGEFTAEKAVSKLLEGTKLKVTVRDSGALLISHTNPAFRDYAPKGWSRLRLTPGSTPAAMEIAR